MRVGIVVTDERFLVHVKRVMDGVASRGWEFLCFLTDTGVNLLVDPEFMQRAGMHPEKVSVCEHSVEKYSAGRFDLKAMDGVIVIGSQYRDAELVQKCDKVLVF